MKMMIVGTGSMKSPMTVKRVHVIPSTSRNTHSSGVSPSNQSRWTKGQNRQDAFACANGLTGVQENFAAEFPKFSSNRRTARSVLISNRLHRMPIGRRHIERPDLLH